MVSFGFLWGLKSRSRPTVFSSKVFRNGFPSFQVFDTSKDSENESPSILPARVKDVKEEERDDNAEATKSGAEWVFLSQSAGKLVNFPTKRNKSVTQLFALKQLFPTKFDRPQFQRIIWAFCGSTGASEQVSAQSNKQQIPRKGAGNSCTDSTKQSSIQLSI